MLNRLYIKNVAIIDDLELEFCNGFNVFTGQTGAGKSLIIGSIEFLLGFRRGGDFRGKGSEVCLVAGEFDVQDKELRKEIEDVLGEEIDDGELVIRRRINSSGKVSSSVNSVPVSGSVLKRIGELLVDIHGQYENQFLLKPVNQLRLLDRYGSSLSLAEEFRDVHCRLRELKARKKELESESELRSQQIELYEFQLNEIEGACLEENELEELENRYRQLSNVERLRLLAGEVINILEEGECPVSDGLRAVYRKVDELASIDESLAGLCGQVDSAITELDDVVRSLSRYSDSLDFDGEEFARIDERLSLLNRLVKKYGEGEYAGIFRYREEIEKKLKELRDRENDFSDIDGRIAALVRERLAVGKKLSKKRRVAADRLAREINKHLKELAMGDAEFSVEFAEEREEASCGLESVEFMIRTNPGYPAMPLRKIASGGELSRIMLAIKSVLARSDRSSVLVFDEIDSNVGGRLGEVIGRKLLKLADKQQVICISHLPQIAAFADRHFVVRKKSSKSETISSVAVVEGRERVMEIAEMISGSKVSETTIRQAEEMLAAE